MKKIFTSWLFFTSLMLILLVASLTLPKWMDALFGSSEQQLTQAVEQVTQEAREAWAELVP